MTTRANIFTVFTPESHKPQFYGCKLVRSEKLVKFGTKSAENTVNLVIF
jgi:hypothetical protein